MADSADIELIEGLQLRFALANSDEQLQKLVVMLLVPLLDKLDIASSTVRTKIIGLLGQINKKLKGRPQVTLPFESLVKSTLEKEPTGFSQNFRLMYVTMAVGNADKQGMVAAIPQLLDGIHSRPKAQHVSLVTALLTAIMKCGELSDGQLKEFQFPNSLRAAETLLTCARDLFLLNPISPNQDPSTIHVAAGLNTDNQALITNNGKATWLSDKEELQTLKLNMVRIVGSEQAFPTDIPDQLHERRFMALLCASTDPYFQGVADFGKDSLKRMRPVAYESPLFVDLAYAMFLGDSASRPNSEAQRSPVPAAIRLKLLGYLSKSMLATTQYPQWSRTISESLFSSSSTVKLRQHGMIFLQWSISKAPEEQVQQVGPDLLQDIYKVLSETRSGGTLSSMNADTIRGAAFVAWGTLVRRTPTLIRNDLEHVQSVFEAFETETATVRLSIQEALVAMLPAYKPQQISTQLQNKLLDFLKKQLKSPVHQARYCALRYAISVFPFSDMNARWLCILGLADSKPEIQFLARSGLLIQPSDILDGSGDLPELNTAIRFIYEQSLRIVTDHGSLVIRNETTPAASNPRSICGMLDFGRSLLLANGMAILKSQDSKSAIDLAELESVNDNNELNSEFQRNSMRCALSSLCTLDTPSTSAENMWVHAVSACLSVAQSTDTAVLSNSLMYVVELLSLGSDKVALSLLNRKDLLFSLLDIHSPRVQRFSAQALSIIYATKLFADGQSVKTLDNVFWGEQLLPQLASLLNDVETAEHSKNLDKRLGSIIALGHIWHGLQLSLAALNNTWAGLGLDSVGSVCERTCLILTDKIQASSKALTQPLVAAALCLAIGEIGKTMQTAEPIKALMDMYKQSDNAKVQEAAISSLANTTLGDPEQIIGIVNFLIDACGSVTKKQLDIHFRTGEALAVLLGRFDCTLTRMDWIFPMNPILIYGEQGIKASSAGIDLLLTAITTKLATSTNSQERQAAAIWTMSIARFCPSLPQLTPWLSRLHTCLSRLLSDRNELTQEVSSQTLGLLYEMGDAKLREDMMYSLISLFGTTRTSKSQQRQQQQQQTTRSDNNSISDFGSISAQQLLHNQIESNEPLLEQESLGQTPDGHAVNTTYKSILSLASDMQNPSLVYQFMQLATHTAIWNSRCGAAYGFARIIEQAREAIQPYMEVIVPKLYRYTFDPSPQTQMAMKSIWQALLGPKATSSKAEIRASDSITPKSSIGIVEQYWDSIMEECLASMGQREWKVRESGCNALAGAIGGADSELAVPYLERIWQMSFRTLDDIKGSVREAGLKMCQSLATATVAWCTPSEASTPGQAKRAQAVLQIVVPYLVDKGAVSDAEDVRSFSIGLLLKLCKSSGRYLSSSAPIIVERLLESLSNMESQVANYFSFHTGAQGISREELESARLSAVKASPIMRGIEMVLEQLTPESMKELVPKLQDIIRHGLGLPTRAGCARTVVILCVKQTELVKPFASALVKAISGSLAENSALQRQAWAAAIGYMAPMLSQTMFKNLLKHAEKVYFEKYEDEMRGVSGQLLEQLAQRCPERLCENTSGPGTISFVLFGCWDCNEAINKAFSSAWQEYKLGVGAGLVNSEESLSELFRLPLRQLSADSWASRIQSAKAIAEVAQMVERISRTMTSASGNPRKATRMLEVLVQASLPELIRAMQGRLWPGKEQVLATLVKVCISCAPLINKQTLNVDVDANNEVSGDNEQNQALQQLLHTTQQTVCDILLKEMAIGDISYRREAVARFSSFIEAIPLEIYDRASGVLLEIARLGMVTGDNDKASNSVKRSPSAMDVDADDDKDNPMRRPQQLLLVAVAIKALQTSLPKNRCLFADEAAILSEVLRGVAKTGVWNTRVASLECLAALFVHITNHSNVTDDSGDAKAGIEDKRNVLGVMDIGSVLDAVRVCATEGKYVSVRAAALDAAVAIFDGVSSTFGPKAQISNGVSGMWQKEASTIAEMLASDPVPSISDKAKDTLRRWNTGSE
ncbi:proteasome component M29 [Coemansia spiralis]|uniref:Proteasome component M29 n=2 Tax=Coemansia TaxID=4863 RepID=A0A9W8G8F6_9FUNG|nr:proteasome component M29 [Coemansia umbellata]KAJ2625776.1 proteasome component M29 [Coemansia sp. RSA 1358]KAJ2680899.1 proteasome component M29 [Coemansia spiralis]